MVRSEKELSKAAAEWPASRFVWNSFAGVAPFTDCKPLKKFDNRDKAVGRIWTTIQRLGNAIAPKPVEDAKPREESKPAAEPKKARKPKASKGAKPAPNGDGSQGQEGRGCRASRGHAQGRGRSDAPARGRGYAGNDHGSDG